MDASAYVNATVRASLRKALIEMVATAPADPVLWLGERLKRDAAASRPFSGEQLTMPSGEGLAVHFGDAPLWRGEICRLPLHCAGVAYEDVRYPTWYSSDPPELEIGEDKKLTETTACARYCASLGGLTPKDCFLAAQVDDSISILSALCDAAAAVNRDLRLGIHDAAGQAVDREQFHTVTAPKWLRLIEAKLANNGNGFLVGSSATNADIALCLLLDSLLDHEYSIVPLCPFPRDTLSTSFPLCFEHCERFQAHPRIHAYIQKLYPKLGARITVSAAAEGFWQATPPRAVTSTQAPAKLPDTLVLNAGRFPGFSWEISRVALMLGRVKYEDKTWDDHSGADILEAAKAATGEPRKGNRHCS